MLYHVEYLEPLEDDTYQTHSFAFKCDKGYEFASEYAFSVLANLPYSAEEITIREIDLTKVGNI